VIEGMVMALFLLWFWLWLVEPASSFNLCVRTDDMLPGGDKPGHDR
jgi:hypothetical protein